MYITEIQILQCHALIMCLSCDSFGTFFYISQCCNNIFIDPNSPEEDPLVKKLIVVMKEDRSVIHRRETQCRDTNLEDVRRGVGEEGEE